MDRMPPRVEIGAAFDGGAASRAALEWATTRATSMGADLVVIGVDPDGEADPDAAWAPAAFDTAEAVVAEAVEWVRFNARDVRVRSITDHGDAAQVLVDHSRHLGLLAVGRGAHPGHRSMFEAQSRKVAATAACPVVLVPSEGSRSDGPVVLGVGSGEISTAPLWFAADLASDGNRPLHIVHAWWSTEIPVGSEVIDTPVGAADVHQAIVDRAVAAARARHPGLEIVAESVIGDGLVALRAREADASVIVVGRRRSGLFASWLLGTIVLDLLAAPRCPIAVVPVAPAG